MNMRGDLMAVNSNGIPGAILKMIAMYKINHRVNVQAIFKNNEQQ